MNPLTPLTPGPASFERHCARIARLMSQGKVAPFLGAGVNLSERDVSASYVDCPESLLPSGGELAEALASEFDLPLRAKCSRDDCSAKVPPDLLRVAQDVQTTFATGPLYDKLRRVFQGQFLPTSVHAFLASLPATVRKVREKMSGRPVEDLPRFPIVLTTNYDDVMERAFEAAGEVQDVVFYKPGRSRDEPLGRFWHADPEGGLKPIQNANSYPFPFGRERPVVVKIHGTIDRQGRGAEGFVISEDDYIEYLVQQPLETLLPSELLKAIRNSYILFLGYSLRDWNLRVFLRTLWRDETQQHQAWAVSRFADGYEQELEHAYWQRNGVGIVPMPLRDYVAAIRAELCRMETMSSRSANAHSGAAAEHRSLE